MWTFGSSSTIQSFIPSITSMNINPAMRLYQNSMEYSCTWYFNPCYYIDLIINSGTKLKLMKWLKLNKLDWW
ncbi:hypothetical protein [Candidatus Hodgkinia cicadicola]|uniref:hypothetical protein n=1 Tax=Candidatus Hodgkinia cicadicola TaxID=573658 RepID=UPI001788C8F8